MKTLAVIGIFAITVFALFAHALFGPRVLLDTNPYHYEPWAGYAGEGDLAGKTYKLDSLGAYLPRDYELSRSIHSGRFPLWNPYVFGGMPFFADPQTRVLYPISLLLIPLDPMRARGFDVAIHMLLAMIGMYLFLRTLHASTPGAILGAGAYALSSFFYVHIGHPTFIAAAAWIPFFFFGYETARKSKWSGTLMLTIFFAMGYLAGFPQVFLFGVGAVAAYALYLAFDSKAGARSRNVVTAVRILGVAGALAAMLVSVQLVPFVELAGNSRGLHIAFDVMRDVYRAPPIMLLRSIVPNFFGHPVEGTDWSGLTKQVVHPYSPDFGIYCGLGTLLLGLGSIAFARKSAHIRVFLLMLLLSAGIATAPLLLRVFYTLLPMFQASKVSRLSVLSCFALSALAGLTMSRLSVDSDPPRRRSRYIVASAAVIILVASLLFVAFGETYILDLKHKAASLPEDLWQDLRAETRSLKIKEWSAGTGQEWFTYEKRQIGRSLVLLVVCAGLIWLYASGQLAKRRTLVVGALLVAVVFVDAGWMMRSYLVSQPSGCVFETESVKLLKERLGKPGRWRTTSTGYKQADAWALPPNTNQIFGIHSLKGTSTIVPEGYFRLYKVFEATGSSAVARGTATPFLASEMVPLDFACVRYVITSRSGPPLVASPVLRVVAARGDTPPRVRLLEFGGETRQALCQAAGEVMNFIMDIPPVGSLDFAFGFEARGAVQGDSLTVGIAVESPGRRVIFTRRFDQYGDRGRWHDLRFDISDIAGTKAKITMGFLPSRSASGEVTLAGWGDLDFVYGDCALEMVPGGYAIDTDGGAEFLGVRITGAGGEIPLKVGLGDGRERILWVYFPDRGSSRNIKIDVRDRSQDRITVRSDSLFNLEHAKIVHMGTAYVKYDLISDSEMYIYENLAAVGKGLCIDGRFAERSEVDGRPVLKVPDLQKTSDIECGTCEIETYGPEKVVLVVSADRDCFLVFQDVYYPGWKASVDGQERDIIATDTGMRAVEVGPGPHRVEMEFRPRSLRIGLVLTGLGLLGLTGVVCMTCRMRPGRLRRTAS